jgi:transposase
MAERVRVREIDDDEGRRLLRIIRRGTGSVVTWRRAQMVLLSAQGMSVVKIAEVTFTSADRIRDVIHNFNTDGFDSLYPKYKGGRPKTFTLPERREIKKIAKSKPAEHGLPFSGVALRRARSWARRRTRPILDVRADIVHRLAIVTARDA